jgi:hypothetical protein
MIDLTSRLRDLSLVLVVGVVLALAAGANYLAGQYGGAVAAGVGSVLACSFAVLTGG